jgi:hypothetical protein
MYLYTYFPCFHRCFRSALFNGFYLHLAMLQPMFRLFIIINIVCRLALLSVLRFPLPPFPTDLTMPFPLLSPCILSQHNILANLHVFALRLVFPRSYGLSCSHGTGVASVLQVSRSPSHPSYPCTVWKRTMTTPPRTPCRSARRADHRINHPTVDPEPGCHSRRSPGPL